MKNNKNEKGITIISLIITIIVMLILLGVSIDLVIDGDLFDRAEEAVEGTNAKVATEQSRVDELMEELDEINSRLDVIDPEDCTHNFVNGICTECNLKRFYILDVPCYALQNQSWEEWVFSDYCTDFENETSRSCNVQGNVGGKTIIFTAPNTDEIDVLCDENNPTGIIIDDLSPIADYNYSVYLLNT